jgi:hypothetical protein
MSIRKQIIDFSQKQTREVSRIELRHILSTKGKKQIKRGTRIPLLFVELLRGLLFFCCCSSCSRCSSPLESRIFSISACNSQLAYFRDAIPPPPGSVLAPAEMEVVAG